MGFSKISAFLLGIPENQTLQLTFSYILDSNGKVNRYLVQRNAATNFWERQVLFFKKKTEHVQFVAVLVHKVCDSVTCSRKVIIENCSAYRNVDWDNRNRNREDCFEYKWVCQSKPFTQICTNWQFQQNRFSYRGTQHNYKQSSSKLKKNRLGHWLKKIGW